MFSWSEPAHRPIIIAHRGASAVAPENTLAAFRQAIDDGADAIEFDVRLTKDGEVVVIHDSRLQRTTDGSGCVRKSTWKEIRNLNAGSWFHRRFAKEKIPALEDVLALVNGRIGVNIEIKADRHDPGKLEIVDRCCNIIRQYRTQHALLLSSFDYPFLKQARNIFPTISIGILTNPLFSPGDTALRRAKALEARYIIVNGAMLRKRFVQNAHRFCAIAEYTVNSSHRIQRALRYEVDALFTNDPRRIISLRTRS